MDRELSFVIYFTLAVVDFSQTIEVYRDKLIGLGTWMGVNFMLGKSLCDETPLKNLPRYIFLGQKRIRTIERRVVEVTIAWPTITTGLCGTGVAVFRKNMASINAFEVHIAALQFWKGNFSAGTTLKCSREVMKNCSHPRISYP